MRRAASSILLLHLAVPAAADDVGALAAQLGTGRAREAADRLAELGPAAADAVPQLAAVLRSDDAELRWRAAWALSRIGRAAWTAAPELVVATERQGSLTAMAAGIALRRIGRAGNGAVVAAMRAAPEGERGRYLALLCGTELDAQVVVPALLPLLNDEAPEVQLRVWNLLEEMGEGAAAAAPEIVRTLRGGFLARRRAAEVLAAIGPASVGPLRGLAMDPTASPDERGRAIGALARIPGPGIVAAEECLRETSDRWVWQKAVSGIGDAGARASDLAPVVAEHAADVPFGVGRALLAMGAPGEAVIERMLFSGSGELRRRLVRDIGGVENEKVVPWLLRLAEDVSGPAEIRMAAVRSLAESRLESGQAERALALVRPALKDHAEVACALAAHVGPPARPLAAELRPLLEHDDPRLRVTAACALYRIGAGDDTVAAALARDLEKAAADPDGDFHDHAVRALAEVGTRGAAHYEFLLHALANAKTYDSSDAVDGLVRMLPALGDRRSRVLAAVERSVEIVEPFQLAGVDDLPTLLELLAHDSWAWAARERLVALGPRGWEPLVAALDAGDAKVRPRAATALLMIDAAKAGERAWLVALASGEGWVGVWSACTEQPRAAPPVLMKALASNDAKTRARAAHLLGQVGHREAMPALRAMVVQDDAAEARCAALWGLDALLATQ